MNIWRLRRGGSGGFVIMDWRTLQALSVTPDLGVWLSDAARQAQALEWYAKAGGGRRTKSGAWTARELERQVKPRLQQAFSQGELIAIPHNVVTGGPKKAKDKGPEDLLILTRSELGRSPGLFELDHWLHDAMLKPLLLDIYKCVGGYIERGQWTTEDLHNSVKARLQEAFRHGELIALAPDLLPLKQTGKQGGQSQGQAKPTPQPAAPPVPAHPATSAKGGAASALAGDVAPPAQKQKTWIEIVLRDDEGHPIAGEPYKLVAPDGTESGGKLDEQGRARLDGLDPGACKVSFPQLDGAEWRPM